MKAAFPESKRGFSLVEVTIAMAIAAVALVTLIGMLPQGMDTMREAGDMAIEARIHQQILSEMQMASFDKMSSYDGVEFFYDAQGEELGDTMSGSDSDARGSFEHIYSARATVPEVSGGPLPGSVGGGNFQGVSFDQNSGTSDRLRMVLIEVAAVGGRAGNFDWDDPVNHPLISTYRTYVADMGKDYNRR